jgi:bacterioferritin
VQGSPRVIEALNDLLTLELTVVNQYFVHSKMCQNWGYARIAGQQRAIAMEEMRDAEEIIDRILFLDGVPNMQRLGSVTVGETVSEQFQIALEGEHRALELLHAGILVAIDEGDSASREFFAGRLLEEEGHVDYAETQLGLIQQLGEANYLAQQLTGDA